MSIHSKLAELVGNWDGTNRLHLSWMPNPLHESRSDAVVKRRVGGQCLEIAYTWEYEGKPHEGLILLSCSPKDSGVKAFWTDSWHSADVLMMCDGAIDDSGRVSVKGSYSVPDHPDWGWRTEIIPGDRSFQYLMYNVSPDGVEEIAVETIFAKTVG